MAQIRLAGGSLLTLVRGGRESVGALENVEISARLILRNLLDQGL
jgi:hypothetical protein